MHEVTSSLQLGGRDAVYTGMSDTVARGVGCEALLAGKFKDRGVQVPLHKVITRSFCPPSKSWASGSKKPTRICS